MKVQLYFLSGQDSVELDKTVFVDPSAMINRIASRAKSSSPGVSTFRWTAAVQGLSLLLVKAAYYRCKGVDGSSATIEGDKDSLAASLDYALSKQPAWLNDMFGIGATGDARLRDLIARTNAGRKRPGPVTLSLNTAYIGPECVEIFLDGLPVKNGWAFNAILSGLQLGSATESLNDNADGQSETHRPPFRSTVIQPASIADIHEIHAYERVEFPGCHATLERLLEWRNHDPTHFSVLKYPDEAFLAYYILLFPKPASLAAFLKGDVEEDELGPEHLVTPTKNSYLSCTAAHICAASWKQGTAFFGMDLFWHLIDRIIYLASHGVLSELYAELPTPDRQLIATQFGFCPEPERLGHPPLFKITITPMLLKQWESNIRTRAPRQQSKTLLGV